MESKYKTCYSRIMMQSEVPDQSLPIICKESQLISKMYYLSTTHHRYPGIWPKEHEIGTISTTTHCIVPSAEASTNNYSDFRYLQALIGNKNDNSTLKSLFHALRFAFMKMIKNIFSLFYVF